VGNLKKRKWKSKQKKEIYGLLFARKNFFSGAAIIVHFHCMELSDRAGFSGHPLISHAISRKVYNAFYQSKWLPR